MGFASWVIEVKGDVLRHVLQFHRHKARRDGNACSFVTLRDTLVIHCLGLQLWRLHIPELYPVGIVRDCHLAR